MNIINIPPKEMLHLKLNSYFLPEENIMVEGKVDFYFRGKYPNGKMFRKKNLTTQILICFKNIMI